MAGAALLLLVPMGWRAVELAGAEEFTPGLPRWRPPTVSVAEIEFAHETEQGTILVHARLAMPGHRDVGFFKLGPSTFLDLRVVDARCERGGTLLWTVTGPSATLRNGRLEFAKRPTITRASKPMEHCRRVRIELRTGALEAR